MGKIFLFFKNIFDMGVVFNNTIFGKRKSRYIETPISEAFYLA